MKTNGVRLIVLLAVGLLATAFVAWAQQPPKIYRIGRVLPLTRAADLPYAEAFRQGLADLGYVEGRNIVVEYRFAEGKVDRLPDLVTELVRLKVDLIVTASAQGVLAAKNATSTIPIVMAVVGDPVENGFVASLARPGGNVTGQSILSAELAGKRLELLKEILPRVQRIAVLWNPTNPAHPIQMRATEGAARTLRVKLHPFAARSPDDFDTAFQAMTVARAGALFVLDDGVFLTHRAQIADGALRARLPTMFGLSGFAAAGGLVNYGPHIPEMWRRAARYVDKILKGAKPADLPIEQATRFELVVNLKTAEALGLAVPPAIIARADEVIR